MANSLAQSPPCCTHFWAPSHLIHTHPLPLSPAGAPEDLVNYFHFVAEEVRAGLAQLGFRSLDELIGRAGEAEGDQALFGAGWRWKDGAAADTVAADTVAPFNSTICTLSRPPSSLPSLLPFRAADVLKQREHSLAKTSGLDLSFLTTFAGETGVSTERLGQEVRGGPHLCTRGTSSRRPGWACAFVSVISPSPACPSIQPKLFVSLYRTSCMRCRLPPESTPPHSPQVHDNGPQLDDRILADADVQACIANGTTVSKVGLGAQGLKACRVSTTAGPTVHEGHVR